MFILFVQLFWIPAYCQNPHEETSEAERVSKHRISIMIGHTHVPKGVVSTGGGPCTFHGNSIIQCPKFGTNGI